MACVRVATVCLTGGLIMGGTVLISSATSIGGRRRSKVIAWALGGAMALFVIHTVADCGNVDDTQRAWRSTEVRAW